ncbi:MAG TPA: hypothetical protein PKK45_20470, partial [Leptospiraceae bacterium]|nr:hypothetical protein [Leptospiraceae bacterium]
MLEFEPASLQHLLNPVEFLALNECGMGVFAFNDRIIVSCPQSSPARAAPIQRPQIAVVLNEIEDGATGPEDTCPGSNSLSIYDLRDRPQRGSFPGHTKDSLDEWRRFRIDHKFRSLFISNFDLLEMVADRCATSGHIALGGA